MQKLLTIATALIFASLLGACGTVPMNNVGPNYGGQQGQVRTVTVDGYENVQPGVCNIVRLPGRAPGIHGCPANFGVNSPMVAGQRPGQTPLFLMVNGQQSLCTPTDRAATAVRDGAIGFLGGLAVRALSNGRAGNAPVIGAGAGFLYGASDWGCRPALASEVRQFFNRGSEQVATTSGNNPPSCDGNKKPGKLNLPGNPKHGQIVCAEANDIHVNFAE
jgi:hypothetical protein